MGKSEGKRMSDKEIGSALMNERPTGEFQPADLPDTTSPVNSVCVQTSV